MKEEVFGPAAPIYIVDDEAEAIRVANDTGFGLGASIWTNDLEKAGSMAAKIESGIVNINHQVRSDIHACLSAVSRSLALAGNCLTMGSRSS